MKKCTLFLQVGLILALGLAHDMSAMQPITQVGVGAPVFEFSHYQGGRRIPLVEAESPRVKILFNPAKENMLAVVDTRRNTTGNIDIKLYDISSRQLYAGRDLGIRLGIRQSLVFDPTGRWLAAVDSDDSLVIWEQVLGPQGLSLNFKTRIQNYKVGSIAFSPDGKWLAASSSSRHTIRMFDMERFRFENTLQSHGLIGFITFSPNGKWLVGAGETNVEVWERAHHENKYNDQSVSRFFTSSDRIMRLEFSLDSRILAVSSGKHWQRSGRSTRLYNFATLKNPDIVPPLISEITDADALSFNRKGELALSTGRGDIVLWDTAKDEAIAQLKRRGVQPYDAVFNPSAPGMLAVLYPTGVSFWQLPL